MTEGDLRDRVRVAHADAWQEIGRGFAARGGGVLTAPGLRLMASGLPHPKWNSGDATGNEADIELAREFYAHHDVPWGLRIPPGLKWPYGRLLLRLRLMGLLPASFTPVEMPRGVTLATAGPADLEAVLAADSAAFESDPHESRAWMTALLEAPDERIRVCAASADGEIVGTGYAVLTDSLAGRTAYIAGVAVAPAHRRRRIGAAISAWLASAGFAAGADLAHLHADHDRAARLYGRLGFVDSGELDVYGDM
jgi:ribosomal protein S18 acetylase RimI-like enzyme